jgi:hypothetical protein
VQKCRTNAGGVALDGVHLLGTGYNPVVRTIASPLLGFIHRLDMSLLVVDRVEQLERITRFTEAVKRASVSEASNKKAYEKRVDKFLDFILEEQKFFRERGIAIKALLLDVEQFSWFSDLDEESSEWMQKIIAAMNRLHGIMLTRYIKANNFFTRNQVALPELRDYKAVADDLRELAADLNARVFVFPQDDEFQAITNELNGL